MKGLITFVFIALIWPASSVIAQLVFPTFLEGTWKMENGKAYEQWKILDDRSLKGTSYRFENGEKVVTEHLEIRRKDNTTVYTARVFNQNKGKGIDFILQRPDSLTWVFENPKHDFPKKIAYQKRSETEVHVQVLDGRDRGISYLMKKVPASETNILLPFFKDLRGVCIATPHDSSFVSRLEYKNGNEQFLLTVGNTLTTKGGTLFTEYEGIYVYNPVLGIITFTTVTKKEIHTGICEIKGDTLFHKAQIEGSSSIKSYSSAIVKMKDGSLKYYADYSKTNTPPELSFQYPLTYRKKPI